jgi:PhzF family phenazine biosynthesis protein
VELCGHATLASAHVLKTYLGFEKTQIEFDSQSGTLLVTIEEDDCYTLNFPADTLRDVVPDLRWKQYFNQPIIQAFRGTTDYIFRVESEGAVRDMEVKFNRLTEADGRGFIVTAEGSDCDYVSRCFYPQAGIDEDPATGSSHTTLAPFWSERLGKKEFTARQLSSRGAYFETRVEDDRVLITGKAFSYMHGFIEV